ncbi:hypothetical protein BpHYR1_028530 [Brachionus plicatilis]|uniref:Uncharacterized protein n=1 Tax=Brachionus plicatilis TaxID=10195 RepID=A0A3M7PU46_BRAPC|nr:hypothetical protein BpHYR1_028530 [Brachionus plicatilis]
MKNSHQDHHEYEISLYWKFWYAFNIDVLTPKKVFKFVTDTNIGAYPLNLLPDKKSKKFLTKRIFKPNKMLDKLLVCNVCNFYGVNCRLPLKEYTNQPDCNLKFYDPAALLLTLKQKCLKETKRFFKIRQTKLYLFDIFMFLNLFDG